MVQADALLAAGFDQERLVGLHGADHGVYTVHLLLNKEYGWWTEDVEIVHLDGVFLTRSAALLFVEAEARRHFDKTGEKVTGGYAWHMRVGEAAVWEDIGSQFPIPEWSARADKEA